MVKVENSLGFAEALRRAGVPFDLQIYQKGPHAIALGSRNYGPNEWHHWLNDLVFWLKAQDFVH